MNRLYTVASLQNDPLPRRYRREVDYPSFRLVARNGAGSMGYSGMEGRARRESERPSVRHPSAPGPSMEKGASAADGASMIPSQTKYNKYKKAESTCIQYQDYLRTTS